MLWDSATRVEGEEPARAVAMLLDATLCDFMTGDMRAAAASAGRARELAKLCAAGFQSFADMTAAMVACTRGELTAAEFEVSRARAADASTLELPAPAAMAVEMVAFNGEALVDAAAGGRVDGCEASIAAARQRGALSQLPFLLGMGAAVDQREGVWTRAWAQSTEAAELAGDNHQWTFRAWG